MHFPKVHYKSLKWTTESTVLRVRFGFNSGTMRTKYGVYLSLNSMIEGGGINIDTLGNGECFITIPCEMITSISAVSIRTILQKLNKDIKT